MLYYNSCLFLEPAGSRRAPESEEQIRRAAEREGRRTRRRCEREKNELLSSHLDGMSSDDETSDRYQEQLKTNLGIVVLQLQLYILGIKYIFI